MRRVHFLLVVGTVQIMFLARTAWAQDAGSFVDDFDGFDAARWSAGGHRLGRSYLDPTNVGVDGGKLSIAIPARTFEGGEILTNDLSVTAHTQPASSSPTRLVPLRASSSTRALTTRTRST